MNLHLQLQQALQECERLKKENNYLKQFIQKMTTQQQITENQIDSNKVITNRSSPEEKILLFHGKEHYNNMWVAYIRFIPINKKLECTTMSIIMFLC